MADQDAMADQDTRAEADAKMVLRTVYLPPELDDQLRVRAFRMKQTKNELIRDAVARWLLEEGGVMASAKGKTGVAVRPRPRSRAASRPRTSAAK